MPGRRQHQRWGWLSLIVLLMTSSGLAHHSFAMYDHTRTVTLKGTVTKFQWTNPHAYIELDVSDGRGGVKHFSIECTSINMMQRLGWRSNMIKSGDQVKAVVAPLSDRSGGRTAVGDHIARRQENGARRACGQHLQANA